MLLSSEVVNFLEDIKNDYGWFLYSYDFKDNTVSRCIQYPACCLLSAQLISSFLYVHFSKDTKCIYDVISNGKGYGYGHAWSTFNSEIVDFTHFQFEECSEPLKSRTKISRQQFEHIMNQISIFYTKENHNYAPFEGEKIHHFQEQSLLAVDYAKKYNPTKEGFMEYLSEAIQIEKQISYR